MQHNQIVLFIFSCVVGAACFVLSCQFYRLSLQDIQDVTEKAHFISVDGRQNKSQLTNWKSVQTNHHYRDIIVDNREKKDEYMTNSSHSNIKRQHVRISTPLFFIYDTSDFTDDTINFKNQHCPQADKTDRVFISILQNHHARTHSPEKASIFIIPSLLLESYFCNKRGHAKLIQGIMKALKSSKWFHRSRGADHLIAGWHHAFSAWAINHYSGILPEEFLQLIENVTMTRYEAYGQSKWLRRFDNALKPFSLFRSPWEVTKRSIIVPYIADDNIPLIEPYYETWVKRKNMIWYHTRTAGSAHGATVLRHRPWLDPNKFNQERCLSCNIGRGNIDRKLWLLGWSQSRFCLVIRGDTPSSHALYNAIRGGCIPILISHGFDKVSFPFRQHLSERFGSDVIDQFTVRFSESDWKEGGMPLLLSKLQTLMQNVTLLKSKLEKIRQVQRLLLWNHPDSQVASLALQQFWCPDPFSSVMHDKICPNTSSELRKNNGILSKRENGTKHAPKIDFSRHRPYRIYMDGEPGGGLRSKTSSQKYDLVFSTEILRNNGPPNVFFTNFILWEDIHWPGKLYYKTDNTQKIKHMLSSLRPVDVLYTSSNCNEKRESTVKGIRIAVEQAGLRFEYNGKCSAGSKKKRYKTETSAAGTAKMMIAISRSQDENVEALDEKLLKPMEFGTIPIYQGNAERLAQTQNYPAAFLNRRDFFSDADFTREVVKLATDKDRLDEMQEKILSHKWTSPECSHARKYIRDNPPPWLKQAKHRAITVKSQSGHGKIDNRFFFFMRILQCTFSDFAYVNFTLQDAARGSTDIEFDNCCW